MIQVDADGEMLGMNKPADLAILGDAKLFLAALAERLEAKKGEIRTDARKKNIARYNETMQRDRRAWDRALADRSAPMNPAHVASVCREFFADDAILVADGGNTTIWASFYHQMRVPNTLLSTFKFGMLGAGVAQALGAAVALPGREVVCIIGDGAMGFHPQEIETAVRNKLAVIYLVLCDRAWGMVKMNQSFTLRPLKTLLMKSPRAGGKHRHRTRRNRVRQAGDFHGRARRARVRSGATQAGAGALPREQALRRDPRRRQSGQAHVGAGADPLQGHAPGAEREIVGAPRAIGDGRGRLSRQPVDRSCSRRTRRAGPRRWWRWTCARSRTRGACRA